MTSVSPTGVLLYAFGLLALSVTTALLLSAFWRSGLLQGLRAVGHGLSGIDSLLVRRVTWLFGTRWVRWRYSVIVRWLHLVLALCALAVAGALAPLPLALGALAIGYLGTAAIVRQWSWDEQDRARELPSELRRIYGGEDLTNEALFAGAFLFVLTPVLFFRIDQAYGVFALISPTSSSYAAFVFGEFLRAIPLFDYADVYETDNISGIHAQSMLGKHLTFAFRSALDLILVAGIIQLIGVMQRIASGDDIRRIQEALATGVEEKQTTAIDSLAVIAMRRQGAAQRALVDVLSSRAENQDHRFNLKQRLTAARALETIARRLADRALMLAVIEAYRVAAREHHEDSRERAMAHVEFGHALVWIGSRSGGADRDGFLNEAVSMLREAAAALTSLGDKDGWALAMRATGDAFVALDKSAESGDARPLTTAIEAYQQSLKVFGRDRDADMWADTMENLCDAMHTLGEVGGPIDSLGGLAVAQRGYEQLAEHYRLMGNATKYARVLRRQASLWLNSAEFASSLDLSGDALDEHRRTALSHAENACRLSLKATSKNNYPEDWAAAHITLGSILRARAETPGAGSPLTLLRESVSSVRKVLEVRLREASPTGWATAQYNLGNALSALAEVEEPSRSFRLFSEAIECYDAALHVRKLEDFPTDWGRTTTNKAIALTELAARSNGKHACIALREACRLFDQSKEVLRQVEDLNSLRVAHYGHERAMAMLESRCPEEAAERQ